MIKRESGTSLYVGADGKPILNPNGSAVKVRKISKKSKVAKQLAAISTTQMAVNQFTPPLLKKLLARANINLA